MSLVKVLSGRFYNETELREKLIMWQEILMMKDWTIIAKLRTFNELREMSGEDCMGFSMIDHVSKCAFVNICDGEDRPLSPEKYCAEETLVHELLHCKYNIIKCDETYEGAMLDVLQHQRLEEMAKSLMMARYNIPFDYWREDFWDSELAYDGTKD